VLIRYAQTNGLPIPILKASNPLPSRRLVVIPSSPSTHEYGLTFDSIVPATPVAAAQIEKEVIEVRPPPSRGSITTAMSSDTSISMKEEKKGFRLSIFKGVFSKSKSKKQESTPLATLLPPSPPTENPSPPITLTRSDSTPSRRPITRVTRGKPELFQFSMEPVPCRDSNKGVKERPTPSYKTIEKYINPMPIALPRFARDLIHSTPSVEMALEPSEHSRWRYAGRALAEWEAIVKQCDGYIDSVFHRRGSIPEETAEEDGDGTIYLKHNNSATTTANTTEWISMMENLHIPRMTVELPKFYFTGRANRDP
jgi:hypothetical protein